MGRPLKIAKKAGRVDGFNWADTYNIGVVGGDTTLDGAQVLIRVKIGANAEADGYIIRQKGSRKFLVTDGSNTGVCQTANLTDTNLTDDTMTISIVDGTSTVARLERMSNKYGIDFAGNHYALSFTDSVDATEIKSGTAQGTIDVAQVDNDSTFG